ncbi:MAG: glycosyltransferase family 4 protein [Promethearchaeota archaeon]
MIKLAIVGLDLGPGSFGGVNNYTKLLLDGIDRKKCEVYYYSLGKSPNWYEGEDKPTLLEFGANLIKKLISFSFFLKKNRIEVVHLNSGLTQVSIFREGILSILAKLAGCKSLFFIHGWKEKELNKISRNRIKKILVTKVLNKQDGTIVLAEHFKEKLIDLGVDGGKIFVSSTMVESERYRPEKKIFSRPFKVLFCANMVREKGPYELLGSVPLILDRFTDTRFIFVGKGEDLDNLKSEAERLGIEEKVIFTGYVPKNKKMEIFKEAHVFAFPTYYGEGFPTVVLEAMAAGLPIVTTPNAGLVNAIEDGKDGFLVKTMPSEPKEIAEKIIQLIENPDLMKKMSENNLQRAKEEFDAQVVSRQIVEIYQNI